MCLYSPLNPSNIVKMSQLKDFLNSNSNAANSFKSTMKEAKEKLGNAFDQILKEFNAKLTRKKDYFITKLDEQVDRTTRKMDSYHEKTANLSNKKKSSIEQSALIVSVNGCHDAMQFQDLIVKVKKIFQSQAAELKEEASELETISQSLLNKLKFNPNGSITNLSESFKKKVHSALDDFFEQAGILDGNVEQSGNKLISKPQNEGQTSNTRVLNEKVEPRDHETVLKAKILEKEIKLLPPIRPISAYGLYSKMNRARFKVQNPDCDRTEITKIVRRGWEKLSMKDRSYYFQMANKNEEKYRVDLREYEAYEDLLTTKKKHKSS